MMGSHVVSVVTKVSDFVMGILLQVKMVRSHVGSRFVIGLPLPHSSVILFVTDLSFSLLTLCGFFRQFSGCWRGREPQRACTGVPPALLGPKVA